MLDLVSDASFGRFRMDGRRRALCFNGKPIPLHARAYDVLEYLVANRDRVLTKEDITAHVWRGQVVAENNLTVQMSALRRVLGDHGGAGLIVTFAGRGYRFVGDVMSDGAPAQAAATPAPLASPPPASSPDGQVANATASPVLVAPIERPIANTTAVPRRRRTLIAASAMCGLAVAGSAGLALHPWRTSVAAPRLSVAVLPFRNLTDDPHQDHQAEGITDDLQSELANALRMQVTGRDSVVNVVQRHLSIPQIGRELRVRYVLDGSFQKSDAGYVVNPQLDDAQTGMQLWSAPFTVTPEHLGNLRDIIVRRVARQLGYGLDALESRIAHQQRPDDPDAVDLYYQANAVLDDSDTTKDFDAAAKLLKLSIKKQPNFVDALARLGWVLLKKAQFDVREDSDQDYQLAQQAIERARQLDRQNPDVLAAYALQLELSQNCPEAEHVAKSALLQTGSNLQALSVLTNCAWDQGRFPSAESSLDAAELIDPVSEAHQRRLILRSYLALLRGDAAVAVALLTGYIADHPDSTFNSDPLQPLEYARILRMAAYVLSGRLEDAKADYVAYSRSYPNRSTWRINATNPRSISQNAANANIMLALAKAGVPEFADARPRDGASCTPDSNDFSPTPNALPAGGRTFQTRDMLAFLEHPQDIFVIDVGPGVAAFPGAIWGDHGATGDDVDQFVASSLQDRTQAQARVPVVIMGAGPFGCTAYLAAATLIAKRVPNVVWYRAGEEGWARANDTYDDHRKY